MRQIEKKMFPAYKLMFSVNVLGGTSMFKGRRYIFVAYYNLN